MNTNNTIPGTDFNSLVSGTRQYFDYKKVSEILNDDYMIFPSYEYIHDEFLDEHEVVLELVFYQRVGDNWEPVGGHYVTVTGVSSAKDQISIADPWFDILEGEPPSGSSHGSTLHNNAEYTADDFYNVYSTILPGNWSIPICVVEYPIGYDEVSNFQSQNISDGQSYQAGRIVPIVRSAYSMWIMEERASWEFSFTADPAPGGQLRVWGGLDGIVFGDPVYDEYVITNELYYDEIPFWSNCLEMRFDWDYWCGNVNWIYITAPVFEGDSWHYQNLAEWFSINIIEKNKGTFNIPHVGDSTGTIQNVYVAIDLEEWLANQQPKQDEYEIVDGSCADLPGYFIGTSPIIFDTLAGHDDNPFVTTPLTGTVYLTGQVTCEDNSCCIGIRGNLDSDVEDKVNIVDLTFLVAYLFGGGLEPECWDEGNVEGDALDKINIVDLTYLVSYLFGGGPAPADCP